MRQNEAKRMKIALSLLAFFYKAWVDARRKQ